MEPFPPLPTRIWPRGAVIAACGLIVSVAGMWVSTQELILAVVQGEEVLTRIAISLSIALAAAWLFLSHFRRQTARVAEIAIRRTGELRALNAILVADNTARQQLAQELEQKQSELRQLADHNARIKEDERKRIAREIHDDLGQSMLALRIELSMVDLAPLPEASQQRIRNALRHIDTTVETMRIIINELRPAVLDLGLKDAIEWEIAKFRRNSGIDVLLDIRTGMPELSDDVATQLYRVVQESLTNICRHARASRVVLTLWLEGDWLFMTIADNGIGIAEQCRRKSKSFGLIGIAERIYALGGAFHMESAAGKGTTLIIAVPRAGPRRSWPPPASSSDEPA